MLRWVLLHNPYHIVVINRHFQIWEWAHHQLHHLEHPVRTLATLEVKTERTYLPEVVVVAGLLVVDINVVTLLLCLRLRRPQRSPSRNEQHLDSNSQFQVLLVRHQLNELTVHLEKIKMDKVKAHQTMCLLVLASVAEEVAVVTDEARVLLSAPMDEAALPSAEVVHSSFLQAKQLQMPVLEVNKVTTSKDGAALPVTIETPPETSRATGETSLKAHPHKTNKVEWVIFNNNRVLSSQATETVVQ
jgi:hypothetical protein